MEARNFWKKIELFNIWSWRKPGDSEENLKAYKSTENLYIDLNNDNAQPPAEVKYN